MNQQSPTAVDVSVVIPVHDGASTIQSAVESALAQEFGRVEVVVVDDGSTDATAAIVASVDDPRVELVRQRHVGVSAARNAGAAAARGHWLVFLDADDQLNPGALAALIPPPDDHAGLVVGRVEVSSPGSSPQSITTANVSELVQPFLSGSFSVDARVFHAVRGYDERLRYAENTELSIRLLSECSKLERSVRTIDTVVLRVHSRRSLRRHARYAERILAACDLILREHQAVLDDEGLTATYAASAGVAAARLRRWRTARQYFAFALRSRGRRPSDAARWVASCIPVLRESVWPQSRRS